jgi:hypothetical protein
VASHRKVKVSCSPFRCLVLLQLCIFTAIVRTIANRTFQASSTCAVSLVRVLRYYSASNKVVLALSYRASYMRMAGIVAQQGLSFLQCTCTFLIPSYSGMLAADHFSRFTQVLLSLPYIRDYPPGFLTSFNIDIISNLWMSQARSLQLAFYCLPCH